MKKQVMFMIFMILMTGVFAETIYIPGDYATIQEGINASEDGDEIIVSPGTYIENINFAGKAVILGSLFYTTQNTSYISQTIIDGNQKDSVVRFKSKEDSTSVLIGFTITNGHASSGGGIYCNESSPILENVTITGNSAKEEGGGIYCSYFSSPSLVNVTITDNSAGEDGGGIYCIDKSNPSLVNVTISNNSAGEDGSGIYCSYSSSPSLENVTISNNSAGKDGSGIYCLRSSPSLVNVTITNNSVYGDGGGINCYWNSSPSLVNVTITDNSADGEGGGIFCWDHSSPSLENVTISNNSSVLAGGGIYCGNSSSPSLVNCIFCNNSPQEVFFKEDYDPNTITIAYSVIDGGVEGIETNNNGTVNWLEGNIDADPLFLDALVGDYHLTEDSPCIDTGIAYFEFIDKVLIDLSKDEYSGSAPDMGAYE